MIKKALLKTRFDDLARLDLTLTIALLKAYALGPALMARRWLAIAAGIPVALLLFAIFIIIFTPIRYAARRCRPSFRGRGLYVSGGRIRQGVAARVQGPQHGVLADERGVLFRADDAVVRLRLLPLLAGKGVSLGYRAGVGNGYIRGSSFLSAARRRVPGRDLSHLRLEDIPFFLTATGTRVKGDLRGEGNFRGKRGERPRRSAAGSKGC